MSTALDTYTTRLARFYYLSHYCYEDHPVLETETKLIKMAESKLRSQILTRTSFKDLPLKKVILKPQIKERVKSKLANNIHDRGVFNEMCNLVDGLSFDSLFILYN